MSEYNLAKKIAYLEFVNDQLTAEIFDLDQLMRQIGFKDGLETVKATAQEIYEGDFEEEV